MDLKQFFINNIEVGHYILKKSVTLNSNAFDFYFKTEQRMNPESLKKIEPLLPDKFTIVSYLEIDPKFRKKGLGKKLLNEIKSISNQPLVLIAETHDDFLVDWYKKEGFEIIGYCYNLPIMVFKI